MIRCPQCNHLVVYNAGEKLKIRTRMLALSENGAEVVCRKCGADVPLDLAIGSELKSVLEEKPKRLIVKKTAKMLDTENSTT